MSECVVRIEMPNGCHDCKLRNMIGNCPIPMFDGQDEEKIWTLAECFQRPPWCPIICQLPEGHGRLIDADALADDVRSLWDYKTVDGITATTVLNQTLTDIRNCPTIVPAERSE